MPSRTLAVILAALTLTACATTPAAEDIRAPQPAKTIDADRFYTGRWLEIARLPMGMTDGCVAGASTYDLVGENRVAVRDTCQIGTPQGREKAISGRGEIMDPGTNAKMRVRYLWGFVTWDYWVLDRADDYSWFISADPTFEKLWIYAREVPSDRELAALVARVEALGYDPARLEFPAF